MLRSDYYQEWTKHSPLLEMLKSSDSSTACRILYNFHPYAESHTYKLQRTHQARAMLPAGIVPSLLIRITQPPSEVLFCEGELKPS